MQKTEYITDREIYEKVILDKVPFAEKFLWIGTSDIKDMYIHKGGLRRKGRNSMVPFLEVLSDLIGKGVLVRLIHAKEPGPNFRKDFDKYKNLIQGLERMRCPRVHFKSVIIPAPIVS